MSTFNHQPIIELTIRRCSDCGLYFATESCWTGWHCPYCAAKLRDEQANELAQQSRTIAALRGTVTRTKRRRRA